MACRRSHLVLVAAALAALLLALAAGASAADRGTIAFQANRLDGRGDVYKAVWTMNPDGSGAKRLEEGLQPSISRDGKTIAFVKIVGEKNDKSAEIFVMDADGGHVRQVTDDKSNDSEPALSPDGQRVAYVGDRSVKSKGELPHLFIVDVDGSNQRQLTSGRTPDREPSFSPNGNRIAFIRAAGESKVATIDANGDDLKVISNPKFPFTTSSSPSFSPDGQRILFGAFEISGGDRIFSFDADNGGSLTRITQGDSEDVEPAYSPEGGAIVFCRGKNLFAMDADGADVRQLSDLNFFEGSNILPSWGR